MLIQKRLESAQASNEFSSLDQGALAEAHKVALESDSVCLQILSEHVFELLEQSADDAGMASLNSPFIADLANRITEFCESIETLASARLTVEAGDSVEETLASLRRFGCALTQGDIVPAGARLQFQNAIERSRTLFEPE